MYKLGHLENNGQNQDVSQCNSRDVFTGHNMSNSSCSLSSPPSDNAAKSSTTSVLRRWRRPETHDSSKNVQAKDVPTNQPTKYVNPTTVSETEKQMNQVGNYETSPSGSDYSMFVPQLSPLVHQSTAGPYDSTKYLPHVQYSENGGYTRTSPVVPQNKEKPIQNSYYHQENTNQEVHFRSPSYPVQNTPPLAHSSSQKCILPNENNNYPATNQKIQREYNYPHRDYSVVAHNYSPQKNTGESKISSQGVTEDPSYCLSKGGYVQDSRISYPLQNVDRRVSPTKSPIYRNYSQNNTQNYPTQNTNYYLEKPTCASQKQYSEKPVLDARYVQNYNPNYVVKNPLTNSQDPKHYRNVINNPKKSSPPFPILEQRLNQGEPNYCTDYAAQGYYPTKYGPLMFSRTSPTPKIVRDTSHNYIPPNVHHNPKIPAQEVMIPSNYSFPNKYYQQNQGQEWKIPKEYEQNMYLSQMNQMHARLPNNTISKTAELPRDLSYVDQNQRVVQKNRMYESPVEHLQYTGKSVVPVTQKSPKMVGFNIADQRTSENDYSNLPRPCGTVMKPNDYQRSKVNEYSPVIQSVKSAEIGLSRDYLIHQQSCDQQTYACSPPLAQNSRNPPPYPVGYPRQSNIKMNEIPARNISPRRTFQENMPVVVFSPQHIGLPKSSPNQMYPSEYPNQHYPGYYARDPVYPSGVKPGIHQYPVDQTKYPNIQVNRNIPQQRYYGYTEHQYHQHKHPESTDKISYYQGNMYRTNFNHNLPEHLHQNAVRAFEDDYRNAASNYNDFETNRVDDRSIYSKKDSDIGKSLKEFLESWEDDEEIVANLPDLVLCNNIPPDKQKLPFTSEEASESSKSSSDDECPKETEAACTEESQPLYILGSTNISSEALPQYLAVYEQVDRLPDNIKGFYKDPSPNNNEETQSVAENTEKPVEKVPTESKSVIRESLSPHDLTVNKNRKEEKTDEEEVLNLSTNRNKENDEFLVEEYSNASDSSVQESPKSQGTEIEIIAEELDTNYSKTKKPSELSYAAPPEENVGNFVNPTEDKQEPIKNTDLTEKITEKLVQETQENVQTAQENVQEVQEDLQENEVVLKGEPPKCPLMMPLRNAEPKESDKEDGLLESKDKEDEQPKDPAESTTEKSLTTSVIVQNTFFDNASLNNKNEQTDKLPEKTEDHEETKTIDDSTEIIPEIQIEDSKEKSELSEKLREKEITEIVENDTAALNTKPHDSKEIEDYQLPFEISEEKIKNSFDVIDFDTTEIIPPNEDKTGSENPTKENEDKIDSENPTKEIEDHQEEIVPISFDNLINSPENIEMKDDEANISEFEHTAQEFSEINNTPSTPKAINFSDVSESQNISEISKVSDLQHISEVSMSQNVSDTEEETSLTPFTEEVNCELENSNLIETETLEKEDLSSNQNDFKDISKQPNVGLDNNSRENEKGKEDLVPENVEIQVNEENVVLKSSTDEEISKENESRKIPETMEEENKENIACISVARLSPIPNFNIPEDTEKIEQSSIDNTNNEVDKIEESTVNYVDEEHIEPSPADHSNTEAEDIEDTIINNTDKQEIEPSLTDLTNTEVKDIEEPTISYIDKEQIEPTSITDSNTEVGNIETSTFINTDTEILEDTKSPIIEEFIKDIKVEIEEKSPEEMDSTISNSDTEIVEDFKRQIIDDDVKDFKLEIEEHVPEDVELDNIQINQEFVKNEELFESTVDKLIITNVETIQDDSIDSIIEEESITEPASQENNVIDVINSSDDEITAASEESDTLIDVQEVQDLIVPAVQEIADTKQNEDDTREECSKSSQDDAEAEYAHLIEIENSEEILRQTENELPQINIENIKDNSDKTKNENTNFDFSYLESCTDNICEKHEDRTVDLGNNNSENKLNFSVIKKEICNNLKSILDSSESESENSKEKEAYMKEVTNEKECTELQKTPEDVDTQSDYIAEENIVLENNIISEKSEHTEIIDETKKLVSPEVEQFPETIVHENNKESTETVPETEILSLVPEIDFSIPEVKPSTPEKEPEIIENSSEVPDTYPEFPENITAIVPVDTVRGEQVILTDPVIVTKGETSEESIILPENLTCVLLYEENQPYFIIDPNSNEEEIIPADEVDLQETEVIIPEMSSEELLKEEDVIVEQMTAEKSVSDELLIPELSSEVESQKNEEILATEPIGEEVIICEEGIEDWVQNEEIIQNNEEEENIETKQLESIEEKDLKQLNQVEENYVENEKQLDIKKMKENKEKLSLEKKLLIEKRKKKLETFKKLKHLDIKQTTKTFLCEEKTNSYLFDEMRNNVDEKELFMNPENPDTIEYTKNSSNNSFSDSSSVIKRSVSYDEFQSPKIDFKAPKRRYSTMENCRSVKKQIINLDEISKNITEVLENLTKQETLHYQNKEEIKIQRKLEVRKEEIKPEIKEKEEVKTDSDNIKEEIKIVSQIKVDEKLHKNETSLDIEHVTPSECKKPKIEETSTLSECKKPKIVETSSAEIKISDCISSPNNVTKLVEQLIKPKLIIPKTNYNLVATQENKPIPNRKPSLPKTPEEDNSSPIINTARLTEPIFPKSSKSSIPETKSNPKNVDPRIERPKEPEKEEKPYIIENKFSLTEYTKNYIKMKTGQTVDPKNLCGVNGTKTIDPRFTKSGHQPVKDKVNNMKKKHQNLDNGNSKLNQKKVKINLQDYRNRKQSLSNSDLNASSTENSVSSPQIEDVVKKDSEENKVESTVETKLKGKTDQQKKIQKIDKEISDRKVDKLVIKPKKSLDSTSKDPLLTPEVKKGTTNPEEPKETNNTNNHKLDCKNLENVNSKSKVDLKQSKPKKRKRRFRNLYTVDEEDEVPTKQQKNSQDNETTGMLTNDDSTSSKISEDSSLKANEDSQSSEMSSSTNGEFLCCLDMNSNGSSENNCGFKCHIKLNAIGEKIRDYEINKNSSCNPNRLKLTLTTVKNKKPAFSDVLSNLDSLVESKLLSKRHKHKPNSKSKKSGDGTMWTINNKVPKVIIKRNGSGYCAVFRDVSSNPIWQPKIRLKRQKYIESLVLRSNVKV